MIKVSPGIICIMGFLLAMNGSYIDIKRLYKSYINNHYIILIMAIYYIMAAIHIYIYICIDIVTLGELAFHGPWKIR